MQKVWQKDTQIFFSELLLITLVTEKKKSVFASRMIQIIYRFGQGKSLKRQQLFPDTGSKISFHKTFCQFNLQLQNPNKLYCLFTGIPLCKAIACASLSFKVLRDKPEV